MINKRSIFILCSFISLSTFAQEPIPLKMSWRNNWIMDIKTGTATVLTPVSEKYLFNTNNLNVPVKVIGPLGTLSLKKAITSHVEMGYQFDYLRLQGEVDNGQGNNLKVLTQLYTHNFLFQYNFKKNNIILPLFNYFWYFKLGGVFMQNNPVNKETAPPLVIIQKHAIPQAFVSALGAGMNYQLSENFSLTGSLDINNTSNGVSKVLQFPLLLFSNHIMYYSQLSFGLSWWFNIRPKGFGINDPSTIWFDKSRGKM